ncbi:hypothetical protein [Acetobacterium bakii]|nr:hypothetical protein [Acetobacterium bakii]
MDTSKNMYKKSNRGLTHGATMARRFFQLKIAVPIIAVLKLIANKN